MEGIDSGKFFEIYEKWFGVNSELPYAMDSQIRKFMIYQSVPK